MTRTPPRPSTPSLTTTLRKRNSPHLLVNAQHSTISQVWLNGVAQALANIITTNFPLTLSSTIIRMPTGSSEGTISMQEGEVLSVVEEDKGDGWTRVRRNNGDEGYIPTSYATITLNKWPHPLSTRCSRDALYQTLGVASDYHSLSPNMACCSSQRENLGGESLHNGLIHSSSKDEWESQGVYYVRKWGRQGWNIFFSLFCMENNAAGCHVLAAIAQQTHQFLWWLCLMVTFDCGLSEELRYIVWPWSTRRVLCKDLPSAPWWWCDFTPWAKA